ncbi:hypothetical protein CHU67_07555 [Corynebacterium sp. LK19]|uniref:hypothetical protein n=1 Tax=unclassified Corynebacterium TaxID=2624378 RepID=UPI0011CB8CBA|nr:MULTISPECIES: hypothetical protein [unclassified Corynebacterium]TXS58921.1 hypothetical protein CHU67_07555 [Corynebacterium sp. LK19]TXS86172.1 hypothetical protein CHU70_00270 [Corynebacterium sp. LK10]
MAPDRRIATLNKPRGEEIAVRARRDLKHGGHQIFLIIGREPYLISPSEVKRLTNNLIDLMEQITNA